MSSVSSSITAILRFAGWSFLPSALADVSIKTFYRFLFRSTQPPVRGTPAYAQAYRIAYTTLAAAYLIYTLIASTTSLQPNYYHILGVGSSADESALKTAFRKFARRNHPDRPEIGEAGAARFREVRDAYEMLKNPVKRFAYERFGPEVVSWKDCTTPTEYLRRGAVASSGFPIGTALVLGLLTIFQRSSSFTFWRYVLFSTTLFIELYLVLSPTIPLDSTSISYAHSIPFISGLLPFQQIIVIHQAFVSISVCISQLAPVLFPGAPRDDKEVIKVIGEVIKQIAGVGGAAEHEVNRMIQAELQTLRGVRPALSPSTSFTLSPSKSGANAKSDDEATVDTLTNEMESLLLDVRLRSHPVISTMWERVAEEARERLSVGVEADEAGISISSSTETSRPVPDRTSSMSMSAILAQASHSPFASSPSVSVSGSGSYFQIERGHLSASSSFQSQSHHLAQPSSPIGTVRTPTQLIQALPSPRNAPLSDVEDTDGATLIDPDTGRSRSASPFVSASLSPATTLVPGPSPLSAPVPMPNVNDDMDGFVPTPRSFGKSSAAKLAQRFGPTGANGGGNVTPGKSSSGASGAKFFTSAFSSLK